MWLWNCVRGETCIREIRTTNKIVPELPATFCRPSRTCMITECRFIQQQQQLQRRIVFVLVCSTLLTCLLAQGSSWLEIRKCALCKQLATGRNQTEYVQKAFAPTVTSIISLKLILTPLRSKQLILVWQKKCRSTKESKKVSVPCTLEMYCCVLLFCLVSWLLHSLLDRSYTMAPEVLNGQGYSKQVDLWSIGVITFMLASSQMPFFGSNRAAMAEKIVKGWVPYYLITPRFVISSLTHFKCFV